MITVKQIEEQLQGVMHPAFDKNVIELGLIEDILRFFEGADTPVSREQTLEVMKIREGVIRSFENGGRVNF